MCFIHEGEQTSPNLLIWGPYVHLQLGPRNLMFFFNSKVDVMFLPYKNYAPLMV